MPTAALHSAYWKARAGVAPLVSGPFVSYPMYQTSVVYVGLLGGVFQALYDRWRPTMTTTADPPPKG